MALLEKPRPNRKGMIRGREARDQNLNAKLTETEYQAITKAAAEDGKTVGEWTRDLVLRYLRLGTDDVQLVALSEAVGSRLLTVNVLRSLVCGQRLTTEAFDKLVNEIATMKFDLAVKLLADRRR